MNRFNPDLTRPPAPTIRDVAARAGVSVGTVSNCLSGQRLVLPATADRVRTAILDLNYRPNGLARGLRSRRSRTIGLLVPDNANPFFAELAWHVEQISAARGFALMLCNTGGLVERELTSLEVLLQKSVDGIVLDSIASDTRVALRAIDAGVPMVVLDREIRRLAADTVAIDSVRGGALAAQHLLELGHRRLACILGPANIASNVDRLKGFRSTLATAGIEAASVPVFWAEFRADAGYRAALTLFDQAPDVSAVFAADDLLAFGVIRAALDRGRPVPSSLSVVGFDDIAMAAMSVPRLTTVRQPLDELARQVLDRLTARIARPDLAPRRVLIPPTLVARESTAPPPNLAGGAIS